MSGRSEVEKYRAIARENTAKAMLEHERKHGRDPSYAACKKHVNARADAVDKQKDWKK